ncbi:hypothetical protein [Azomonas macrocytogenes]|uniref:Uncharacterized protein n=1 Tax=Azomonas macrocytogenes TaxID=69962 RepID=A0A839T4K8_AZOMA|nr:hypothetical protein [Azomonas macrocytogenes]MBB3104372.1 hypothetical protein [Azomonas macrocytogenes]
MSTWIIAFNKDGNTSSIKVDSGRQPDLDDAVELVTRKAEQDYEVLNFEPDLNEEQTPALKLAERYGITITGIAQI